MLSVPEGLHDEPARPSIETDGIWVIDYVSETPSLSVPVVVTRPTFVFIHEGVKELTTSTGAAALLAPTGALVTMRTGAHLMSDLLPMSGRYASTILSVERDLLVAMIGRRTPARSEARAIVTQTDESLRQLVRELHERLADAAGSVERALAAKQVLASILLDREVRELIGADLAGWGDKSDRVRLVIGSHCYSPLRLSQYASMCAMSVSSFQRAFVEAYGEAPGSWLIATRLEYAAHLLRSTPDPVTDVSANSGFGDLSNFTRSFRRRFGTSPTAYRREPAAPAER